MEYLTAKGVSGIREAEAKKSVVSLQVTRAEPVRNPDTGAVFLKLEVSDGEKWMGATIASGATTEVKQFDVITASDYSTVRKIKKLVLVIKAFRVMQHLDAAIGAPAEMLFTYADPAPPVVAAARPAGAALFPASTYSRGVLYSESKTLCFEELKERVGQTLTGDVEGMVFRVRTSDGISNKNGSPWRKLTFAMMEPRPRGSAEQRPFIAVDGFCSHMSEEEVAVIQPLAYYRVRGGLIDAPGKYTIGGALVSIGINKFMSITRIDEPPPDSPNSVCIPGGSVCQWPIGARVTFCALVYAVGTSETMIIQNEPKERASVSVYGPAPPGLDTTGITSVVTWNKGLQASWVLDNITRLGTDVPVLVVNGKVGKNTRTQALEVTVDDLVLEDDFARYGEVETSVNEVTGKVARRFPMPAWVRAEFDAVRKWRSDMLAEQARGQAVPEGDPDEPSETERAQRDYEEYMRKLADEEDARYEAAQRAQQAANSPP